MTFCRISTPICFFLYIIIQQSHMWGKIKNLLRLFSCPAVNITMLTVLLYWLFVVQAEFCMFLFVCVLLFWLSFRKPSYVSFFVCPAVLFISRCLLSSCPGCQSNRWSCNRFGCHALMFISLCLLSSCPGYRSYRPSCVSLFGCVLFVLAVLPKAILCVPFCLSCFAIPISVLTVLLSRLSFL